MKCIHITCPNCKKTFEVEGNLIPSEGREVKCSGCNIIWFYRNKKNQKKVLDILKKYPSDLPKDLEDLISDAETVK
tara:strand:- start:67 stop:294 length:228 start_codon:yes stop_codon:yes gene_type:complete